MPTDIATLGIKIDAHDVKNATRELDKLEKQSGENEKANKSLSNSFVGLKSVVVALAGSMVVSKFLETAGSFESMAVSLETVTGSAEKAQLAMDGILEFAKETPYSVRELTDSFIKLKALGIQPTEAALISYGNTASAMGKSLNQMIEAVADASTGEFERLKEFGIKASSQGDQVAFTFQGITETVGKNSEEITRYLESIGQTQFAGAMSKQMTTLNGKLSVLGDAVDQFYVKVGDAGALAGGKHVIDGLTAAVEWLTKHTQVAIMEFVDLGSVLGAYGAVAAKVMSLDFEGASAIIDMRKQDRVLLDQKIAKIWEQKTAQDAANASTKSGIDLAAAPTGGKPAGAAGLSLAETKDLAKLQAKYGDELRLLAEKQNQELILIETAESNKAITEQQAEEMRTNMAAQYADRRVAIAKKKAEKEKQIEQAKSAALSGIFSNLGSLMNAKSKRLFEIGKKASIASALINTYQAITKTMASVPYPWNIGLAAAQGIAGMVQVQNIRSQSYSGGGGGSINVSGGGGTGSGGAPSLNPDTFITPSPDTADTIGSRELRVVVESDGVHSDGMRRFAEDLAETIKDMGGIGSLVVS